MMGIVAAPISLRLDQETRRRVERIARRKKVPPSHVLREAVTRWIEHEEESISPYDSIQDLIGVAGGGVATLSANTGRRFTELLQTRREHGSD
jgi:predicted DNA-binding protein